VNVKSLVQARNYHKGRRAAVRVVVIHDMEAPEKTTTAENIAAYFAGAGAPEASAHDCIDNDSVVPCVRDDDEAWAAPGANRDGIQLELAGYAKQTLDEWLDAYGRQLLDNAAQRTAQRCKTYGLPVRRLSVAQVKDGATKGICGHVDVTKAFPALGTGHTDPGSGFPWSYFLALVRQYVGDAPKPPAPKPTPLVVDGDLGTLTVRRLQAYLNAGGWATPKLTVDGDLGPATWRAVQVWVGVTPADGTPEPGTVRELQTQVGAARDGVLGVSTVKALQTYLNAHA
jgi:hypothetical protein